MMNLRFLSVLAIAALALVGCDKAGVHHYGTLTDVVQGAGSGKLYLRSSPADAGNMIQGGTDMVIFGSGDPTQGPVPFLTGSVKRDSTTSLFYGTVTLDASGAGTFEVTASYDFPYEPMETVAGRQGSKRSDFPDPIPLPVQVTYQPSGAVDVTVDGTLHTYTPYGDVVAAIDLAGPNAAADVFQLYNLGLFFSQVRIPAFGSLGMTRYISQTGYFNGLIVGDYTVSVASLLTPTATITYHALEDFPGETCSGSIVTKVNINGDGPMDGVMTFRIVGGTMAAPVILEGNVDYADITVTNGLASSGNYALTVTAPTALTGMIPYTAANNVDLRNFLPEGP